MVGCPVLEGVLLCLSCVFQPMKVFSGFAVGFSCFTGSSKVCFGRSLRLLED